MCQLSHDCVIDYFSVCYSHFFACVLAYIVYFSFCHAVLYYEVFDLVTSSVRHEKFIGLYH